MNFDYKNPFHFATALLAVVLLTFYISISFISFNGFRDQNLAAIKQTLSPGPQFFNTVPNGLAAKYDFLRFSNASGGITDTSNANNHANAMNGAIQTNQGVGARAASFDGIDDYIGKTAINGLNSRAYSILLWIKPTDGLPRQFVFSIFGHAMLTFLKGQGNFFYTTVKGLTANIALGVIDRDWRHIAITYDGAVTRAYVNNILVGTVSGKMKNTSPLLLLGRYTQSASKYSFKGLIDEVMIYSRALPPSEITALYNEQNAILVKKSLSALGCYTKMEIDFDASVSPRLLTAGTIERIFGALGTEVRAINPGDTEWSGEVLEIQDIYHNALERYELPEIGPIISEDFSGSGITFEGAYLVEEGTIEVIFPHNTLAARAVVVREDGSRVDLISTTRLSVPPCP